MGLHNDMRPDETVGSPASVDDTTTLLTRARSGDRLAMDALFARHVPALRRWASGRLPRWARDIGDTVDLVQDTMLETFKRIDTFEPRGDGALQAYLRAALVNRVHSRAAAAGYSPCVAHHRFRICRSGDIAARRSNRGRDRPPVRTRSDHARR